MEAAGFAGFPSARVTGWLSQLASALLHMHRNSILHRDLTCENILVMSKSRVKIGDLGLSRILSKTQQTTTFCGTPYYMSPELATGNPYGQASDVWALGVVLFRCLTLERPFKGDNFLSLMQTICAGQYDEVLLEACPHPEGLKRLASKRGIFNQEPSKRTSLAEITSLYPAHDPEALPSSLPQHMLPLPDSSNPDTKRSGGHAATAAAATSAVAAGDDTTAVGSPREPSFGRTHADPSTASSSTAWSQENRMALATTDEEQSAPSTTSAAAAAATWLGGSAGGLGDPPDALEEPIPQTSGALHAVAATHAPGTRPESSVLATPSQGHVSTVARRHKAVL